MLRPDLNRIAQRVREVARKCTVRNGIDLSIRSGLALWFPLFGVIIFGLMIIAFNNYISSDNPLNQGLWYVNASGTAYGKRDRRAMLRSSQTAVPREKIREILAWIKTKRPEWNVEIENLYIFLANQAYIDNWLMNEYKIRKAKGWEVREEYGKPGHAEAILAPHDRNEETDDEEDWVYYMFLPWDFDISDEKNEDTLVHELWHYAQFRNNVEKKCQRYLEIGAHFYTATYLMEVKNRDLTHPQVVWNINLAEEYACDSP